jgi:glycine oxidase
LGAAQLGAHIYEGQAVLRLLYQASKNSTAAQLQPRVIGIETQTEQVLAEAVVVTAGAWSGQWHYSSTQGEGEQAPVFPVKGQMLALRPPAQSRLRHTIYYHKLGYMLPKADGSIYVGATSEQAHFDKSVTVEGVVSLLNVATKLAPSLQKATLERSWAGLRPGSADELPLIGASTTAPGLWLATGHFRNGILLGPITGFILAELLQGKQAPFNLNLSAFAPDRFGAWFKKF